jgi:predicted membrane protein
MCIYQAKYCRRVSPEMDKTLVMRGSKYIIQSVIKLLTCRKTRRRRSWKRKKTIWFFFSVSYLFLNLFCLLLYTILLLLSKFSIGFVLLRFIARISIFYNYLYLFYIKIILRKQERKEACVHVKCKDTRKIFRTINSYT